MFLKLGYITVTSTIRDRGEIYVPLVVKITKTDTFCSILRPVLLSYSFTINICKRFSSGRKWANIWCKWFLSHRCILPHRCSLIEPLLQGNWSLPKEKNSYKTICIVPCSSYRPLIPSLPSSWILLWTGCNIFLVPLFNHWAQQDLWCQFIHIVRVSLWHFWKLLTYFVTIDEIALASLHNNLITFWHGPKA